MMSKKGPGIRCTECNATLDHSERCDCENEPDIKRMVPVRKLANTRQIVDHNLRMMEQAQREWDYA